MKTCYRMIFALSVCAFVMMFHAGCANPAITNTSRNIVEQLLISSAVERCIAQIDLQEYKGSKVFIDYGNLATQVDTPFVKGHFELHLAKNGIILAKDEKDSKYTLRLISGTLATDSSQFLFGTPPLPIPVPDSTISIIIPELALFKRQSRNGVGKFSLSILDTRTQQPLRVYESVMAKTQYINYIVMFIPFTSDNLETVEAENTDIDFQLFE